MARRRKLIGGRYRVEKTLHRGDNGTVYLARDTKGKSSKRLAVKVFESSADETGNSHRFENRFRTLLNLRHPNLVRVDAVGWDGPSPFVVYEYVQGKDLVEGLRFGGARRFWQATVEILRALSFLHSRDLLHGDLKPSNILISRSGVKIIDMGLDPAFASAGRLPAAYTLQYLAPEVIRGEMPGPPADLFSLGITLFQALTNRLPFDGVNAEEVLRSLLEEELPPHTEWAENLPAGSDQIIGKLLEKDPYARFGTARDVILAIIQITGTDFALETEKAQRGYIYGGRMVGRQRESEQLESLAADDSGVRVAWMTGASGIGKSRLAREFNYHCQARGIPFLEGSYPGPAAPAFFPLREVLKEAYDCEDEVGANVPPSIARFLGPGEPVPDDMNPGWERFSFYEAVAGAIGGSDPGMPVILHIDNAQFADGSILDLAEYLLRRLPGFRFLVSTDPTISGENGISQRLDRLVRAEGGIILPLEPLKSEEVDALTRSMLGTSLPPTVALRIAKSTGGNPLFVTEVMRGLAAEGILAYGSEGWSIQLEQSESFDLPRDVGQHFRRRLSSIPEDQREALEIISLFRGPPDAGILQSLEILGQAAHLQQQGWLRADRGRFAVSPPVLGSLVADQIQPPDRSGYHSRIAMVLEKLETDPGEIAYHFLEGGDRKGGATWGRLAASEYGRLSPVDSERTLRKILEILPETDTGARVDLLKSLARSREAQGDLDGAVSSYEECCRLKEKGLYEPAERHLDQARVKILERDFEQVERHSREGIRLATRETDPSIQSELFGILGSAMRLKGKLPEAAVAHRKSLAEARKGQDLLSEARARHNLGITNLLTGRPKEAIEELERSLQIVEKSRPDRMGMCLSSLADAHLQAGAYSRALPIVLRSLELSAEQGAAQDRVTALYTLGEIHLHLGDVGSARRCWEEGDRLGRLVGDAALAAGDRVQLAGLARLRSDLSKAVPAARAALRGLKGEADPMDRVHGLRVLAECYLDARLPRRARRVARLALREARLLGSPTAEGVALMVLARVDLLEETSADDARKHLESARSLFAKGGNETYVAFADALIALTDLKEGALAGARARIAATDRSPEDRGHPVHQMDLALACAELGVAEEDWASASDRAGDLLQMAEAAGSKTYHLRAAQLLSIIARHNDDLAACRKYEYLASETLEGLVKRIPSRLRRRSGWLPVLKGMKDQMQEKESRSSGGGIDAIGQAAFHQAGEIIAAINAGEPLEQVLTRIIDGAVRLVEAERAFLVLHEDGGEKFSVSRNFDQEDVQAPEVKISRNVLTRCMESGEAILTTNAQEDGRFREYTSVRKLGLRSILCVPLRSGGGTRGAIYLDNRFRPGAFGQRERDALERFADLAALAVQNQKLLSETRAAQKALKRDLVRKDREVVAARRALKGTAGYQKIRGQSPALRKFFSILDSIVPTEVPVLIQGESGTGKELVSEAIHYEGPRKDGPFLAINCSALTDTLLESELFGHKKGAFTGATSDREGLFQSADGGTLFLDEVGEMSGEMQKKLLRVIQEGEIRPVGDNQVLHVDVRILAATNKKLETEVRRGTFREDLYYRLAAITIEIPPLRAREDDAVLLATEFLKEFCEANGLGRKRFSATALQAIRNNAWPGNVRELKSCVHKAALLSGGRQIQESDLGLKGEPPSEEIQASKPRTLEEIEREAIVEAIAKAEGNVDRAAEILGLHRSTLYRKARKYDITF